MVLYYFPSYNGKQYHDTINKINIKITTIKVVGQINFNTFFFHLLLIVYNVYKNCLL